jgi:hypothetical protein
MDRTRFLIQTHPKEALLTPKRENQVFVTADPYVVGLGGSLTVCVKFSNVAQPPRSVES